MYAYRCICICILAVSIPVAMGPKTGKALITMISVNLPIPLHFTLRPWQLLLIL